MPAIWRHGLIGLFAIHFTVAAGCLAASALVDDGAMLLFVAVSQCMLLPCILGVLAVDPKKPVLEPLVYVLIAVALGGALRGIYMATDGSLSADRLRSGVEYSVLAEGAVWSAMGIAAFVLGYLAPGRKPIPIAVEQHVPVRRLLLVSWLALIVGAAAIFYFIERTGGLSFDRLSVKRAAIVYNAYGEAAFSALGEVRVLIELPKIVAFFWLYLWLSGIQRPTPGGVLVFAMAFLLVLAYGFVTSSRTTIAFFLLTVVLAVAVFRRFPVRTAFLTLLIVVVLAVVMAQLRQVAALAARGEVVHQSTLDEDKDAIDYIVGSGNFFPGARTSAIMALHEEKNIDHLWGSTYLAWVVAFVPRSVWPSKPEVSLGVYVKGVIYGESVRRNGLPSGLVAEAYLNFNRYGIVPMMFIMGFLLIQYQRFFVAGSYRNIFIFVCFANTFLAVAFLSIASNFSTTFFNFLITIGQCVIVFFVIMGRLPLVLKRSEIEMRRR